MIIFIYIGEQITEGEHAFAFWNTVTDSFVSIDDEQVFESIDELIEVGKNTKQILPRPLLTLIDMVRVGLQDRGIK